ncbi:MAG: hypothetical protein ACK2UH_14585 [Candidatus Promineifilaceae bacterium]|jgi:predicted RNA-binding Zn-ribbon protein involved in translation (DUF1610 family)
MKLILLRCPNCAQPLAPDNDDVLFMCPNCFTSVSIDQRGVRRAEVRFALPTRADESIQKWWPYWVYHGRVVILNRETQDRSMDQDSQLQWASPLRMYVPAWEISMELAQEVGSKLIQRQPVTRFIERPDGAYMEPAVISPEDAFRLLEFVILAIEARRKDWLKALDFRIEAGDPELWAMPQQGF